MKKQLLAAMTLASLTGSALAADLPSRKEPIIAPPPPPMWTGFHVGLNAGGTWANNTTSNASTWIAYQGAGSADNYTAAILSGNQSSSSPAGFIGGGQIGYDWQVRFRGMGFVTGVEADIQGIAGANGYNSRWNYAPNAGLSYNNSVPYSILTNVQGNANLGWLGTVRGRLGYLVTPNLLVYGTGGLAYGGYTANLQLTQNWGDLAGSNYNFFNYGKSSYSNTMVGWTGGGGLEWMAMSNWSLKVEYLYYDLGNMSGSLANMAYGQNRATGTNALESITNYSKRINGNLVRAGVNYHFNLVTAPVVAKY